MSEGQDLNFEDLEGLIGEPDIPFVATPRATFEPWHLPRKQYVRSHQWLREIGALVADLDLVGDEFRYLSLPGDDLLDVHLLRSEVCAPNDMDLKFMGFNTSAHPSNPQQQRLNVNLHGLKRLPNVNQISNVYPDDLKLIARPNSVQRKRILEFGPFHALNIDLCDGFARETPPGSSENLFDALEVVLENQSRTTHDSVVFITTRVDSQEVGSDNRELLDSLLRENLTNCVPFRHEVDIEWEAPTGLAPDELLALLSDGERFVLGFAKWIVSTAARFRLSAFVASVLTYRVVPSNSEDDLVSIAIRLSPDRKLEPDPLGLAMSTFASLATDECDAARHVPARISHRRCVDELLASDSVLQAESVDDAAQLLAGVGYDELAYRAWVA